LYLLFYRPEGIKWIKQNRNTFFVIHVIIKYFCTFGPAGAGPEEGHKKDLRAGTLLL